MQPALVERLRRTFRLRFENAPRISVAPGRVNLIGEHTDYNDGYVFPMAIDRHIGVAFRPHSDLCLQVYAADMDDFCSIDLRDLESPPEPQWAQYIAGMAWALLQETHASLKGLKAVVAGDLPIGAGLSSSAALEMATGLALSAVSEQSCTPKRMAQLGKRAENEYVGVSCGIMDQYASALSKEGSLLLLDCRTLDTHAVSLPDFVSVLVMDSGVRRSLSDGAYNDRYRQCQEALRYFQEIDASIDALRDVTPDLLERERDNLSERSYRRARHVVYESRRPSQAAQALRNGNVEEVGRLMDASHRSLRDLYDVSSPELDTLVELAQAHSACYGARLTGAGLGGCAIALVDKSQATSVARSVQETYEAKFNHDADLWSSRPVEGARLLD